MKKQAVLCILSSVNLLQALRKRIQYAIPGSTVLITDNGERGIALAQTERPDLIILDMRLPGVGGDKVLRALDFCAVATDEPHRSQGKPVILLTDHELPETSVFQCIDCLPFPLNTEKLVETITSFFVK